jgi:Carboxypeptidase regulatory-like domain
MRSFGFRLSLLLGILWAGIGSTVWALGFHGDPIETVYVMPSSVSLPVATSYVVSTSWVAPTAYAVPTTYAVPTYYTTAYWMDPVVLAQPTYAATSYVARRGLLGRLRVVERPVLATYATSFVPTTYVAPARVYRSTSYALADRLVVPSAYIASADCVCPTAVAMAAPAYASPSGSTGAAAPGGGTRSRGVQSEADERGSMSSNVGPPPDNLAPIRPGARTGEPNVMPDIPASGRDTSPPAPPAARPPSGTGTTPSGVTPQPGAAQPAAGTGSAGQTGAPAAPSPSAVTKPSPTGGNVGVGNTGAGSSPGAVAPAPATDSGLGAPPPLDSSGDVQRRSSMRPSTYAMRPEFRNVLMGTVLSSSAGEPEEGVRVSVRNAGTGAGKSTTTNAFGRFAVRLADGDWAVEVAMPSGRVYEVSRLHVSDGLITDSLGRRVPTLDITR